MRLLQQLKAMWARHKVQVENERRLASHRYGLLMALKMSPDAVKSLDELYSELLSQATDGLSGSMSDHELRATVIWREHLKSMLALLRGIDQSAEELAEFLSQTAAKEARSARRLIDGGDEEAR